MTSQQQTQAVGAGQTLQAIHALLLDYFDALYRSDADVLAEVLHPQAIYATAAGGELLRLTREQYLPVVAARRSPSSRGEQRHDRVLAVRLLGRSTALAEVQCAIGPKHFTDLLSLVLVDDRWWVISKVFDYELQEQ